MEDNKQIVYLKSDWGKQVIYIVLVLAFLFFSYKKNPTKELFTQELIREYAVKNGLDTSSSMWVSELTNSIFGGFVEPMIKRNDYIIFSTFEVEFNNQSVSGKVFAIGFWDNIIFDEKQTHLTSSSSHAYDSNYYNGTPSSESRTTPADNIAKSVNIDEPAVDDITTNTIVPPPQEAIPDGTVTITPPPNLN